MFIKIVTSPWLNLVTGFILLFSAGYEVFQDLEQGNLGAHHGVLFFGVVHVLKTISTIGSNLQMIDDKK